MTLCIDVINLHAEPSAQMSVEGVWTGEIRGPYGWEKSGVFVIDEGRVAGGNDRHYSAGRYSLNGDVYKAEVAVHFYGPARPIFGEKSAQFEVEVTGKLRDNVIHAQIIRPDRPGFTVDYRLTKRMALPGA